MRKRADIYRGIFSFFITTIFLLLTAQAQDFPKIDPALRTGERREPFFREDQESPSQPEILSPAFSGTKNQPAPPISTGPRIAVWVTEIRTIGNKIFTNDALSEVTRPFLNRRLYYDDLEEIRKKLTLHYIQNGFINSGAVLPDQKISNGVVTFVIVEGELTTVEVSGNRWLRDWCYQSRVKRDVGPPLNVFAVEQRLQLLQQNKIVKTMHAELKPGLEPGKSILSLAVEEHPPFRISVLCNNYQSPSVGAERGIATLEHHSLFGIGDALQFSYGRSEGLDPLIDLAYQLPFTPWESVLGISFRKNDFSVVEEPFQDLDIRSESEIYAVNLHQPVWRTSSHEAAVEFNAERLYSKSSLLDIPFSFSPGSMDGKSVVTALRFSQGYCFRSRSRVVAAQSRFSWGLDALDATINNTGDPDGRFFDWLGRFQYADIMTPLAVQTIVRADVQMADDALLSLEQLPVGGRYSVRGYRENQLVRDNGVIASVETRIPLVRNAGWADYLQLAPFFDYGQAWNKKSSASGSKTIYSVGVGLRWALTVVKKPFPLKTELEFYWGAPLESVNTDEDDLQDKGIHFQFMVSAF